jgi:DNA-directed RNA polymerase specialized sigma24 family protein
MGEEPPIVTDYIGSCFLKIANGLSYRPNFINYTYRQDMISDGIENCLQYIHNFDPEKSKNPFSYFTQIIYYAFIRRIQKEKKQSHVKHMMIEKQDYVPFVTNPGDDTVYSIGGFDPNIMLPDEAVYKPKKKETNKEPSGLENFMEKDKE